VRIIEELLEIWPNEVCNKVISRRKLEELKWCGCPRRREEKGVACPKEGKVQQSGTWAGAPESTVKEEGKQREVRQTFKILREV